MNALVLMDGVILSLIGVIVLIICFISREVTWMVSFIVMCILAYKQPLVITLPVIMLYNFFLLMPIYRVVNENHIKQPFTREEFGEMTSFALMITGLIFLIGHGIPHFIDDQIMKMICDQLPLNACKLLLNYE